MFFTYTPLVEIVNSGISETGVYLNFECNWILLPNYVIYLLLGNYPTSG